MLPLILGAPQLNKPTPNVYLLLLPPVCSSSGQAVGPCGQVDVGWPEVPVMFGSSFSAQKYSFLAEAALKIAEL